MPTEPLRFSLDEMLSLIGLVQVIYVLVYMGFRAGNVKAAALPFLYFLVLGCGFFADFAFESIGKNFANYDLLQWMFWFAGPPLSVLLILQIARGGQLPHGKELWVAVLPLLAFLAALGPASADNDCRFPGECQALRDWLMVTGLVAGTASMGMVWHNRHLLTEVSKQKTGHERYWVILTLVFTNLFFLGFMLVAGLPSQSGHAAMTVRSVVGIFLAYLAGTSLFRIYPQAVPFRARAEELTDKDKETVEKIRNLIDLQKVYHEPAYNRSDLARELNLSEGAVSRVVNIAYGRTLPQLINERRVEDAKRLLAETDATIRVVAEEVGFNSLASFNRVFKEIAGCNPSDFRQGVKKAG